MEERNLLRSLMDNVPDWISFKDAKSRFTRINRACAKLLGVADPKEAVGKTDFEGGETVKRLQHFTRRGVSSQDFAKIDLNEI